MRHNKKINHLGRTDSHRHAMLSNMASSLIKHKRIFTTLAKAKALRKYVEPLVTKSKVDTTHSRRTVFASLQDKIAVTELFTKISEKIEDRPGGYTRIIKTGNRLGDNASMCFIELVDYNENMLKTSKKAVSKTRRSRKKTIAGKALESPTTEAPVKAPTKEAPAKEPPAEEPSTKEALAKEAPVKETAVKEEPAVKAPAQETPAQSLETPVQEAPAQSLEATVQQSPVEAPAQEDLAESPAESSETAKESPKESPEQESEPEEKASVEPIISETKATEETVAE